MTNKLLEESELVKELRKDINEADDYNDELEANAFCYKVILGISTAFNLIMYFNWCPW